MLKLRRRTWIILLLAAGVIGFWVGWPMYRYWRVATLVERFEHRPDAATAAALLRRLKDPRVGADEALNVWHALSTPHATIRKTYPRGGMLSISLEYQYVPQAELQECVKQYTLEVLLDDQRVAAYGREMLGIPAEVIVLPKPVETLGEHTVALTAKYEMTREWPEGIHWSAWRGFPWNLVPEFGGYRRLTGSSRYFRTMVVDAAQAEMVRTIRGQNLDETMRNAFAIGPHPSSQWAADAERTITAESAVSYTSLPADTAARLDYVDHSGKECANLGTAVCLIGTSGWIELPLTTFASWEPGIYHGRLRLRPDPALAQPDPRVTTIWGGTIEFPISFEVKAASR